MTNVMSIFNFLYILDLLFLAYVASPEKAVQPFDLVKQ